MGRPHEVLAGRAMTGGTTVTLDVEELYSVKGALVANLTVAPGPELLDPVTHGLKEVLSVAVTSVVSSGPRRPSAPGHPGRCPGCFRCS